MTSPSPIGRARETLHRIARRHRLDPEFSDAVQAEAAHLVENSGIDDPALEDRTGLAFVSIDGPNTRDLDQAVYIEPDGDGVQIHYALADAAHFVRPDTALFAEALARGASFYLPGWSIPMLPRALSEGVISLNEGVLRRALVMVMRLDASAQIISTEFSRCRIRNHAKLSFSQVQDFLDGRPSEAIRGADMERSLRLLERVGRQRLERAEQRDQVQYRRVEVDVRLADGDPRRLVAIAAPDHDVERYNAQVSILCNIEGAKFLRAHGAEPDVQPIYRVHPGPTVERFSAFAAMLEALVARIGLDRTRWTWTRTGPESLANFLARLPTDGPHASISRAIHRQAVIMNYRSTFSAIPAPHAGVGAPVYARFSAPMREIVGIFLHKETIERLEGTPGTRDDESLCEQVITAANRAREIQRRITKEANLSVLDQLFESDLTHRKPDRPIRSGTVLGITSTRLYVVLDTPPIDVKIYLSDLAEVRGEPLVSDESGVAVCDEAGVPVCCLGDSVTVRVEQRRANRRWVLSMQVTDRE